MPLPAQDARANRTAANAPRFVPDLRRHRRVPLKLAGRFMREDRREYPCELQDVSVGGADFEHLGGLDAIVTRAYRDGFAVQFKITPHKREKLAAQITWLINRDAFPDEEGRLHERIGTSGRKARLRTDENITIDVDVLDISVSGASVGTAARPPIGTPVMLGEFKAVVRRHHAQGLGLQFEETHDIEILRRSLL